MKEFNKFETNVIEEDFQPGDGTRYEMMAFLAPKSSKVIGDTYKGMYIVSCVNRRVSIAIPRGNNVSWNYLCEKLGHTDASTVRALALWMDERIDVEVILPENVRSREGDWA